MSDLNAAATLTLKIDTAPAATALTQLQAAYDRLKTDLAQGFAAVGGVQTLSDELTKAKATIAEMDRALKTSAASYDLLEKKLKETQTVYQQTTQQMAAMTKATEQAGRVMISYAADLEQGRATAKKVAENMTQDQVIELAKQQKNAKAHQAEMSRISSTTLVKAQGEASLDNARRNLRAREVLYSDEYVAQAQADRRLLDLKARTRQQLKLEQELEAQDRAKALARQKADADAAAAIEAARQRDIKLNTSFGMATPRTRLVQATAAANLMEAGYGEAALKTYGSAAVAASNNLGALEAALVNAGRGAKQAAEGQIHWNKAANEAHAFARGLSGALGTLWITYGSLIPLMTGAALGAGFAQAAKQGGEFAYQLTFVKALGGETAGAIETIGNKALELAQSGLYGPVELANGLRILSQAGLDAEKAIRALPEVTKLATVGEMNMEQAATTLAGVMNAFELSVSDMPHIGDVFAKAAALSQTSVQGMTEAMKTASVVGEQYGVAMEDAATALTLLAKVNITGTAAGTAFRNMTKELYAPVPQAEAAMKKLGLQTKDAQGNLRNFADILYDLKDKLQDFDKAGQVKILQRLFGERGAKEAVAMLQLTREEWVKLRDEIANSEGFLDRVSKELEDTAKGQWKQAINTLQVDLIQAFQQAEPIFRDIAKALKEMFASPEFRSGLNSLVQGLGAATKALVEYGPLLIEAGKAALVYAAGASAARLATLALSSSLVTSLVASLVAAASQAPLFASTLLAVARGSATTLSGLTGLAGALSLLPKPLTMVTGLLALLPNPIVMVTGLLAAGGAAWLLYRDRTVQAMEESMERVQAFGQEAKEVLAEVARTIGTVDVALTRSKLAKSSSNLTAMNDRLFDMRGDLAKKYGITTLEQAEAVVRNATTQNSTGETYTAVTDKYRAADAYVKAYQERETVAKQQYTLAGQAQDIEDYEANKRALEAAKKSPRGGRSVEEILGNGREGKGRMERDWEFEAGKSAINALREQQAQEIAILESAHSNKLISEERYQHDLLAIYEKYNDQIETQYDKEADRLRMIVVSTQGNERNRALAHLRQLLGDQDKFHNERELRLVRAGDREAGIALAAWEKTRQVIAKAEAQADAIMERDRVARKKLTLSPGEAAGYDARTAVEHLFDEAIAERRQQIEDKLKAGWSSESKVIKELISNLYELGRERERQGDLAERNAQREVEFQRSYAYGWQHAFNSYKNEATNSAKYSETFFTASLGAMEKGIDEFVRTGKISFDSLVTSIGQELMKLEIKWLASKMFSLVSGQPMENKGGLLAGIFELATTGKMSFGSNDKVGVSALKAAKANSTMAGSADEVIKANEANQTAVDGTSKAFNQATLKADEFGIKTQYLTGFQGQATDAMQALAEAAWSAAQALSQLAPKSTGAAGGADTSSTGAGGLSSKSGTSGVNPVRVTPRSSTEVEDTLSYFDRYYYGETPAGFDSGDLGSGITVGEGEGIPWLGSNTAWDTSFDEWADMFAKGGAFNSSGRLHAFAAGSVFSAGVMGEAGPEAVMPLVRDSQGNLGVSAVGGSGPANDRDAKTAMTALSGLFALSFLNFNQLSSAIGPSTEALGSLSKVVGSTSSSLTDFGRMSDTVSSSLGRATSYASMVGGSTTSSMTGAGTSIFDSLKSAASNGMTALSTVGSAARGDVLGTVAGSAKLGATALEKLSDVAKGTVDGFTVFQDGLKTLGSGMMTVKGVLTGNIPLAATGGMSLIENGQKFIKDFKTWFNSSPSEAGGSGVQLRNTGTGLGLDGTGNGIKPPSALSGADSGLIGLSKTSGGLENKFESLQTNIRTSTTGFSDMEATTSSVDRALSSAAVSTGVADQSLVEMSASAQNATASLNAIQASAVGGSAGGLGSLFGGSSGWSGIFGGGGGGGYDPLSALYAMDAGPMSDPSLMTDLAGTWYIAKGGVFNNGSNDLARFAKGGVFTNRIFDSPTFFRFANGGAFSSAVMGEAGPEAVMPLTRDASGRLGVRAADIHTKNVENQNNTVNNINISINSPNGDKAEIRRSAAAGARAALGIMSEARRYG